MCATAWQSYDLMKSEMVALNPASHYRRKHKRLIKSIRVLTSP